MANHYIFLKKCYKLSILLIYCFGSSSADPVKQSVTTNSVYGSILKSDGSSGKEFLRHSDQQQSKYSSQVLPDDTSKKSVEYNVKNVSQYPNVNHAGAEYVVSEGYTNDVNGNSNHVKGNSNDVYDNSNDVYDNSNDVNDKSKYVTDNSEYVNGNSNSVIKENEVTLLTEISSEMYEDEASFRSDMTRIGPMRDYSGPDNQCTSENPCPFMMISDLDTYSLVESEDSNLKFYSYLLYGSLYFENDNAYSQYIENNVVPKISLYFAPPIKLYGCINFNKRGMEFSEIIIFNGKTMILDDKTGIIYTLSEYGKLAPWVIVSAAPHDEVGCKKYKNVYDSSVAIYSSNYSTLFNKISMKSIAQLSRMYRIMRENTKCHYNEGAGMKLEWGTVKDGYLYVGSIGKEWLNKETYELEHYHKCYVVKISPTGEMIYENWKSVYDSIRATLGVLPPGYIIHEAVHWSEYKKRWFFLPRRITTNTFNIKTEKSESANILISMNEHFQDIHIVSIGEKMACRGYSAFKFIPGTNDNLLMAVSTLELDSSDINQLSYISIFSIQGHILLHDLQLHDNVKYEGITFF